MERNWPKIRNAGFDGYLISFAERLTDPSNRAALAFHDAIKQAKWDGVLEALYPLIIKHGKPEHIRSDNGPEFVSETFQTWLKRVGIEPIHIYPGSPWENGYNERFNGTLRNEILNANWFQTTCQAQATINRWIKEYNHIRPHQSLDMRPPIPETTTLKLDQT